MQSDTEILPAAAPLTRAEKVAEINRKLDGFKAEFLDVVHTFSAGVYTRTGKFKKGEVIIGTKARVENILTIYRGSLLVWDSENGVRRITAPFSEVTPPGRQRIGIALEDVEGANIRPTTATTVEAVENEMFHPLTIPSNPGEIIMQMTEKLLTQ